MDTGTEGFNLKRSSTADQVAELLRSKILSGEYPPGTELEEGSLASLTGVSRSTLRSSIRLLVYDGLITHTLHHGVRVTMPTIEDVDDIYSVRQVLELDGVAALRNASPKNLRQLGEIVERLNAAVKARDWASASECDMQFHRHLVSLLGSARLDRFFQTLLGELRLALILVDSTSPESTRLAAQHQRLYRLLASGKYDEASDELKSHLAESGVRVKAVMSTKSAKNRPTSPAT